MIAARAGERWPAGQVERTAPSFLYRNLQLWNQTQRDANLRLPRMTIRRWMVVVALLAIVLAGVLEARRLKQRRDAFLARAQRIAAIAAYYRRSVGQEPRPAQAEFHAALARHYFAAASRPWYAIGRESGGPE
jgi:hypothetical protein